MDAKFKYLEKVIIKTDDSEYSEIKGKQGVVIGQPDNNDNDKTYIIYFILTDNDSWAVPEKYLVSLGQFENEENIYEKGD